MENEFSTESESHIVPLAINQALVAIGGELAKVGISKDRRNETQGFRFRGIDDTMNVVSPIMARNDVVFLPNYTDYTETERVTGKGATLIYARVRGEFTFISAKDNSSACVVTYGVAMDSGDKACNKAMSAALKYALLQTFLVPTESNEDADATTQEPSVPKPPAGFLEWFTAIVAEAEHGFDPLREAWKDSPEPFRTYAMDFRGDEWAAAKKHATEVTTALKKAAAADKKAAEKPAKATN